MENGTECDQHIGQTNYDDTYFNINIYLGDFIPRQNLNLGDAVISYIMIYLNILGTSFNSPSMKIQAFDSGKLFIKTKK